MRQNDKAPCTFPPFPSSSWYVRSGSQRGRSTFLVLCCPNLFSSPHVHDSHSTPGECILYTSHVFFRRCYQIVDMPVSILWLQCLCMFHTNNVLPLQCPNTVTLHILNLIFESQSTWIWTEISENADFQTFAIRLNYVVPSQILVPRVCYGPIDLTCWAHLTEGCSRKELFLSYLFS